MLRKHAVKLGQPVEVLADLISPPECLWCGAPVPSRQDFCDGCRQKLVSEYYRCQRCATPLPHVIPNGDCTRCRDARWAFERVHALGPYRNELREAVILMKRPYQDALRRGVAGAMAQRMLAACRNDASVEVPPLIVPVPNHWMHAWGGAANTAGALAQEIGRRSGWPVSTRTVRRIRKTAKQGMLPWSERSKNVRGAFRIASARKLSGRHLILVDDVFTSGATAAELARRLRDAGAASIDVLVAARGTGAKEASPGRPIDGRADTGSDKAIVETPL